MRYTACQCRHESRGLEEKKMECQSESTAPSSQVDLNYLRSHLNLILLCHKSARATKSMTGG